MGILDKTKEKVKKAKEKSRKWINKKVGESIEDEAGYNYSLLKDIRKSPFRKIPGSVDETARGFLDEHLKADQGNKIVPGQLVIFRYFEPKTKEELEYYDASPCTIFFGLVNTKEGKRYLGFNIHYYPRSMRYQVMDAIFNLFKPIYIKHFKEGTTKEISDFDYRELVKLLQKAKLEFGVRMYIPNLVAVSRMIPPNMWKVAVYTEGWFKKQTRAAIMNYWKRKKAGYVPEKHEDNKNKH